MSAGAREARELVLARSGDEAAFEQLVGPYRRELQVHCYRMLGSAQDAEDMVQETLMAAWSGLDGFEGRASLRTWLYRIATNACLAMLRRSRPAREMPPPPETPGDYPEPTRTMAEPIWLEPYPDVLLEGIPERDPGPAARYEARESVELAFIVALQQLPPRQRAALVLRDVLGFRTTEIAEMLDTGELSIKGALQRARATLQERLPAADRERAPLPNSVGERELVGRFADAFESGDVDELVSLLTDDALLTMPPLPLEYEGHEAIAAFLRYRAPLRGARMHVVPTRANTQPALGCYLEDAHAAIARPFGLIVLTLEGDRISAVTRFDASVFPYFGLPPTLRLST